MSEPPPSTDHLIPPRPVVRPWLKPTIWIGSLALLIVLSLAGWRIYRREQPRILAERAREAFKTGDSRAASVLLTRALQLNPDSVEASSTLAAIFDQAGAQEAVSWWERVVQLAPEVPRYRLDLAASALRHNRVDLAGRALGELPAAAQKGPEYLGLVGALEFTSRNFAAAEARFAEARALEPGNPEHALNEANARLAQARTADEGRPVLAQVAALAAAPGPMRLPALRVLRTNYANLRDLPEALRASSQILADPAALWPDRLAHLTILRLSNDMRFLASLDEAKKLAISTPIESASMAFWMRTLALHRELLEWGKSMPSAIARNPEVASNLALAANALEDWGRVAAIVQVEGENPWGPLEYLRLALLSRAQRALNAAQSSQASWARAITVGMRLRSGGAELARLAQSWGWKDELAAVLWRTVETNRPEADDALVALFAISEKAKDTRTMLRVFQSMSQRRPTDSVISNNFALLSLLLSQNLERATQIAEDNFRRTPQAPGAILTLAFAHFRKAEFGRAAELVRTLPSAEPSEAARRAPYVAAILRAAGDLAGAREAASAADRATLLPEERELLQVARQ